jgi:hypothetical protein
MPARHLDWFRIQRPVPLVIHAIPLTVDADIAANLKERRPRLAGRSAHETIIHDIHRKVPTRMRRKSRLEIIQRVINKFDVTLRERIAIMRA